MYIETAPALTGKIFNVDKKAIKLLRCYYVLRELYKDRPSLTPKEARNSLISILGISTQTAYRYLALNSPFWNKKWNDKKKMELIVLRPLDKLCVDFGVTHSTLKFIKIKDLKDLKVVDYRASMYQNALVRQGAYIINDTEGIFYHGKKKVIKNGQEREEVRTSKDTEILERRGSYPIARETISNHLNISKSTQRRYENSCRKRNTGLYTQYNYKLHFSIPKEDAMAIFYNIELSKHDKYNPMVQLYLNSKYGNNKKVSQTTMEKILSVTYGEPIGNRFKVQKEKDQYYFVEQLPNSYYDFGLLSYKNKVTKFNSRIRKYRNLKELSTTLLSCEKSNTYILKDKYTNDGLYLDKVFTNSRMKKTGLWSNINNGIRDIQYTHDQINYNKNNYYNYKDI